MAQKDFEWPEHFIQERDEWVFERIDDMYKRAKSSTDSPIEAMFLAAMLTHGVLNSDPVTLITDLKFFGTSARPGVAVFPQAQIDNYRVDFLIRAVNYGCVEQVVVECDGHDFHEKTKEQARKDKSRDRELQAIGYKVYRYTGSEIYADAFDLAGVLLSDIDVSLYFRARQRDEGNRE